MENLLNALASLVVKFEGAIDKTFDYLIAESPAFYEELVRYYMIDYVISIVFMSILIVIVVIVIGKCLSSAKQYEDSDDERVIPVGVFLIILPVIQIFICILLYSDVKNLIKIYYAPRIFLIEKVLEKKK